MEFEKYIKLLALAHPIEESKSIIEWRPFAKGDMLCEIIKRHNNRCIESYWEQWENPILIKSYGEGICVEPHDLSTLENSITNETYFNDIRIILIDLDAIGEEELKRIKECFNTKTFVAQVSRTRSTRLIDMGPPFCNVSEVMVDQETLEKWLISKFCDAYRTPSREYIVYILSLLPYLRSDDDIATIKPYLEALPEVAAKVRDAAIIRGLSEKETITLAYQAAMQEFVLNRIEVQVRSQTNFNGVFLDAIREPVVDMPIELSFQPPAQVYEMTTEQRNIIRNIMLGFGIDVDMPIELSFQPPALRQVNLMELHVTQPMYEMTTEQRNIMLGFGIKEEVEPFVAVVPDQPTVRDSVARLKNVSETTKFSAELPVGLRGMRWNL